MSKEDNAASSKNQGGPDEKDGKKTHLRKPKYANLEEIERRKRKVLYGTRASSKIFDSAAFTSRRTLYAGSNKSNLDSESKDTEKSCKEYVIIDADSQWKAIFDICILLLVGYSCVTSMFYVAFSQPEDTHFLNYLDDVVEVFFWLDLILNFLQSYKHPETYEVVADFK